MDRSGNSARRRGLSALVALGVSIILGTLILGPYGEDWRPSHFDEWRSVALAQRALDSGSVGPEIPVGSPNGLARDISDRNRYLGFAVLLAAWLAWAPAPIAAFKVLALAFLLLYGAGLYLLCRSLGTNSWAALLAVLTLTGLPTDSMLLGPGLVVPSSLGMGLLCLALFAHRRLSADRPRGVLAMASLLAASTSALALTYPLCVLIFSAFVVFDAACRPSVMRERYFRSLAVVGAAGVALFLARELVSDVGGGFEQLSELFLLDRRWHLVGAIVYPLDYMVSPPVLALAAIGAYLGFRRPELRWVVASFCGPLIALAGYHFFDKGIIVPYQRLGVFLAFGAALCTALAVQGLFDLLAGKQRPGWLSPALIGTLGVVLVVWPRPAPPFPRTTHPDRPDPAIEEIAARIAQDYSAPSTFWSAPWHAVYLEALTGLRVAPVILDAVLIGRPAPPLDCNAGWTLVVGPCRCSNYSLAFVQKGIPVFVRHTSRPR